MTMAERRDAFDQKVLDDIARVGWSDMAIFPVKEDGTAFFNYTVGLVEMSHPDLIIMGMGNQQMHGVLSSAVQTIEEGTMFRANTFSDQVLVDYDVAFVEVDDPTGEPYPMSMTRRLYGTVQALQIVWPDMNGRFPWHSDFDPRYKEHQTLLGTWKGPE